MPQSELPVNLTEQSVVSELRALVHRAKSGEAAALPRLRALLGEHPEIWEQAGDLERMVVRVWTALLSSDPLTTEALRHKADKLRADLEGENPAPLESLLAGQVVSCWLEMGHAKLKTAESEGNTVSQATFNLKRAESAQRRYLAGIKTLATLRALVPEGLVPTRDLRVFEPAKEKRA